MLLFDKTGQREPCVCQACIIIHKLFRGDAMVTEKKFVLFNVWQTNNSSDIHNVLFNLEQLWQM